VRVSFARLSSICLLLFLLAALPSAATATLINATVVLDTPTAWSGYVDWTQPSAAAVETVGASANWGVGVVEVPTGGGNSILVITARHTIDPHSPPDPIGLFLASAFGPGMAGIAAGPLSDSQPHFDDPFHFDNLTVTLVPLNATTSRVNIDVVHAAIPEPASATLVGAAGLLLLGIRRLLQR
jgi:hypothetical protein